MVSGGVDPAAAGGVRGAAVERSREFCARAARVEVLEERTRGGVHGAGVRDWQVACSVLGVLGARAVWRGHGGEDGGVGDVELEEGGDSPQCGSWVAVDVLDCDAEQAPVAAVRPVEGGLPVAQERVVEAEEDATGGARCEGRRPQVVAGKPRAVGAPAPVVEAPVELVDCPRGDAREVVCGDLEAEARSSRARRAPVRAGHLPEGRAAWPLEGREVLVVRVRAVHRVARHRDHACAGAQDCPSEERHVRDATAADPAVRVRWRRVDAEDVRRLADPLFERQKMILQAAPSAAIAQQRPGSAAADPVLLDGRARLVDVLPRVVHPATPWALARKAEEV